jgi:heme oxygenase
MAPAPPTLRERLREETHQWHRQVESRVDISSLDAYQALLRSFYGFYAPLEDRIAAACAPELRPFFNARRKLPLLAADLRHFGIDPEQLPTSPYLPEAQTAAAALGIMYVTEGATLGGQVLTRHAEKQLGLTGGQGYRFWSGYGAETRSMWSGFIELLHSDNNDEVVRAAIDTFRSLDKWLLHTSLSRRI